MKNIINRQCLAFIGLGLAGFCPQAFAQVCNPSQIYSIHPSFNATGDNYGYSIATNEEYLVIGAPGDDGAGSVTVFRRIPGSNAWVDPQLLRASDFAADDLFGNSVAIDGERIVVGAPGDDDLGSGSGSVYVFELQEGIWNQIGKVTASNGGNTDFFGGSVAIDDGVLVVGAERNDDMGINAGSAYIFTQDGLQFTEAAIVHASDAQEYNSFGNRVAASDGTIVIGAPEHDGVGNASGAVYLFEHTGTGWQQQAKLVPQDNAANDQFGASVAIQHGQLVVGAPFHDAAGPNGGAAYMYHRYGSTWSLQQKLFSDQPQQNGYFGAEVALSSDQVLIAEPGWDTAVVDAGSVSLFSFNGVQWIAQPRLTPVSQLQQDYGSSLALQDSMLIVGASGYDMPVNEAGAVYVNLSQCQGGPCPADLSQDGTLDFFDVSQFLSLFSQGDPGADFNTDGNLDFFDVSLFLQAYQAGCP